MKLYLKLNNKWVQPDVNKDTEELIALNFTFDSLENPTDYVSEYSYNITLPKTARNNKLFDEYYKLDSTIKYKPTERIEYIYISNGDTISNGEAYLEKITESNYEFAVNGALCTIFNKLLKTGWDKDNTDEDYNLIEEIWGSLLLSPNTVNSSFNTNTITFDFDTVKQMVFAIQKFSNICGFMPTNCVDMDGFTTDKWVYGSDILPVGDTSTGTQNDYDVDDLTMQQMAEFRCYKLRPYIYVLRLWQIFKDNAKEITGYDLDYDARWFNEDYEYLKGLVYTLPMLDTESVDTSNQYTQSLSVDISGNNWSNWINYNATITSPNTVTCSGGNYGTFEWDIPIQFNLLGGWDIDTRQNHWIFNPDQFIYMTVKVTDGTTEYYNKRYGYLPQPSYKKNNGTSYQWPVSQAHRSALGQITDKVIVFDYTTEKNTTYYDGQYHTVMKFGDLTGKVQLQNLQNAHLELTISVGNFATTYNNSPIKILHHYKNMLGVEKVEIKELAGTTNGSFDTEAIVDTTLYLVNGSNSKLTMERIMGDVKPFEILIKFSKMAGLLWIVDDYNKRVKVVRRSDYFWDCFNTDLSQKLPSILPYTGYYDITNITDMHSYEFQPLAWDTHNVTLNFDEGENDYSKKYKEKYGITYGSILIHTQNKINNDTEELLATNDYNKVNPPIFSAEYFTPINAIKLRQTYKKQDDNYLVDDDNIFCYRLKNGVYTTETRTGNYRVENSQAYVLLTNDSQVEMNNKEYCWHSSQLTNDVKTFVRPVFSEFNENGYTIMFAQPYEMYSTTYPASKSLKYIYDEEWKDYLTEVYNPDNKTLTAKVHISGQLYNRLKICPFVKLGNVGYIILEINDWKDEDFTTVKMRQISSLTTLISKSKSKDHTDKVEEVDVTEPITPDTDITISIGGVIQTI